VSKEVLEKLAANNVVQVSIHASTSTSTGEDGGWESRLMPWEYLLTAATSKYRSGPLAVVRYLKMQTDPEPTSMAERRATFIDSAPGRLRDTYDFGIERRVLHAHLGDSVQWDELSNPTLAIIEARMRDSYSNVVHVSGLDSFLGTRELADPDGPADGEIDVSTIRDGMFLRDDNWDECLVESQALAHALTAGTPKPAMISFNLYNSSARSAALAVAKGAGAAIGFQDFLDDGVTEIFFANFYLNWRNSNWRTLNAFQKTLAGLAPYAEKLRGTGIVLWSGTPLVGPPESAAAMKPPRKKPTRKKDDNAIATPRTWTRHDVIAEVTPHEALNYSILHNRQPIFETFSIYKFHPDELSDLRVEVELQIGNERFGYESTFTMVDHVLDLSTEIAIGLTSAMARSLQESVQTTLIVRISRERVLFLSKTYPITLLPTDEWRDDDLNRIWLPSFVLPRDKAVLEIIIAAQRYLMALRDDAFAGFDGYQLMEQPGGDPDNVDAQVRAIWCALVHDYGLNYINPPPVFTAASQRLRTPTEMLRGGRGTCIDLALLVAACLEFVDIKPVIFLLNGHAFPGYWSSEAIRDQFLVGPNPLPLAGAPDNPTPLPNEDQEVEAEVTETFVQQFSWEFDSSRYGEVFSAVQNGDIVPLESTLLTSHGGFWQAIDQGVDNLRNPEDFHSMLDIGLARNKRVTPLPLASVTAELPSET
jgi:hypothetical protein